MLPWSSSLLAAVTSEFWGLLFWGLYITANTQVCGVYAEVKNACVPCRNLSFGDRLSLIATRHWGGSCISSVSWVHSKLTCYANAGCLWVASADNSVLGTISITLWWLVSRTTLYVDKIHGLFLALLMVVGVEKLSCVVCCDISYDASSVVLNQFSLQVCGLLICQGVLSQYCSSTTTHQTGARPGDLLKALERLQAAVCLRGFSCEYYLYGSVLNSSQVILCLNQRVY